MKCPYPKCDGKAPVVKGRKGNYYVEGGGWDDHREESLEEFPARGYQCDKNKNHFFLISYTLIDKKKRDLSV